MINCYHPAGEQASEAPHLQLEQHFEQHQRQQMSCPSPRYYEQQQQQQQQHEMIDDTYGQFGSEAHQPGLLYAPEEDEFRVSPQSSASSAASSSGAVSTNSPPSQPPASNRPQQISSLNQLEGATSEQLYAPANRWDECAHFDFRLDEQQQQHQEPFVQKIRSSATFCQQDYNNNHHQHNLNQPEQQVSLSFAPLVPLTPSEKQTASATCAVDDEIDYYQMPTYHHYEQPADLPVPDSTYSERLSQRHQDVPTANNHQQQQQQQQQQQPQYQVSNTSPAGQPHYSSASNFQDYYQQNYTCEQQVSCYAHEQQTKTGEQQHFEDQQFMQSHLNTLIDSQSQSQQNESSHNHHQPEQQQQQQQQSYHNYNYHATYQSAAKNYHAQQQQQQQQVSPLTTGSSSSLSSSSSTSSTTSSSSSSLSSSSSSSNSSTSSSLSLTSSLASDLLLTQSCEQQLQLVAPSNQSQQMGKPLAISQVIKTASSNTGVMTTNTGFRTRNMRGRPRKKKSSNKGKVSGKLWEFIRDLLLSECTNPSFIRWERREDGVFKFVQSDKVAKMWGERKQNPKMTYEKLSRAMRYYYKSKVLLPVFGRRLVYKFGPNATGWMSAQQQQQFNEQQQQQLLSNHQHANQHANQQQMVEANGLALGQEHQQSNQAAQTTATSFY